MFTIRTVLSHYVSNIQIFTHNRPQSEWIQNAANRRRNQFVILHIISAGSWLLTVSKYIILVIHLVHEWNIVIFPEFNELNLVFHEAQPSGIQDFNELNEGNMTIFHEWTK